MGPWMVMLGIVLVGILALALLTAAAASACHWFFRNAHTASPIC